MDWSADSRAAFARSHSGRTLWFSMRCIPQEFSTMIKSIASAHFASDTKAAATAISEAATKALSIALNTGAIEPAVPQRSMSSTSTQSMDGSQSTAGTQSNGGTQQTTDPSGHDCEFEVAAIIDHRFKCVSGCTEHKNGGKSTNSKKCVHHYLVRWAGIDESESQWIPRTSLTNAIDLVNEFNAKSGIPKWVKPNQNGTVTTNDLKTDGKSAAQKRSTPTHRSSDEGIAPEKPAFVLLNPCGDGRCGPYAINIALHNRLSTTVELG